MVNAGKSYTCTHFVLVSRLSKYTFAPIWQQNKTFHETAVIQYGRRWVCEVFYVCVCAFKHMYMYVIMNTCGKWWECICTQMSNQSCITNSVLIISNSETVISISRSLLDLLQPFQQWPIIHPVFSIFIKVLVFPYSPSILAHLGLLSLSLF